MVAGAVVGAGEGDETEQEGPLPERTGRPLERVSFLAKIVPAREEERPEARGPVVPRSVADLARRLPLERKVAQLFLVGFEGTDLNAEIFRRLARQDIGGIVIGRSNYTGPALLGQMAGEAVAVAREARRVPPWVMADQQGGELNSFSDLPPSTAPADLATAGKAGAEAREAAGSLRRLGVTGVLGPDVDVSGTAGDQRAAYVAVLRSVESGKVPRRRLDEAVLRILDAKRNYGLIG
jgi:beta-glucosidase-like glycosyl hydrolase